MLTDTKEQKPLVASPDEKDEKPQDMQTRDSAVVSLWTSRIKRAKDRFKHDFKRMRENMNFAAGLQWQGQKIMDCKQYVANLTNREVNSKVASLYAKNPTAEYQRRPRMDFALYDGHLESIMPIVQGAMSNPNGMIGMPPQAQALLADFAHGMTERQMIDKVGKSLEILFQFQLDEQDEEEGEFKLQMKQLVRRVITCGVGYTRVSFARDIEALVTSTGVANTMINRAQQAKAILEQMEAGDINETSPHVQQLQNLFSSLSINLQQQLQSPDIKERLVFDFIPSTSIIVDPKCRSLKGFVGARWIAQEFVMPLKDINAIFETDISISGGAKQYVAGQEKTQPAPGDKKKDDQDVNICMWEVLDKTSKTHFFIVDGYNKFVQDPQPLTPDLQGFWPIASLTFNDVEVEDGQEATIYPPSDVQLIKPAQKEINRSRNELMKHRKANAPGYLASKGLLTSDDKQRLENAPSNAVTELEGIPTGTPIDKVIVPRQNVQIQPVLYDTAPQMQDIQLAVGSQQENLGAVNPKGTATGQTIAEQSRLTVTTSNVDDLDDFLSTLAKIGGQLLMKEMQVDTVKRIVGPGCAWPQQAQTREDFCNQIFLMTKAASSGRPNKAIELRNWQIVAPILQGMGANPQFMVRETLRRLDDQLDPEQAFPLVPPQMQGQMPAGGEHQPSQQQQHEQGRTPPPQQNRPGPGQQAPQQKLAMQQN